MIINFKDTRKFYDFDFKVVQDDLNKDEEVNAVVPESIRVKGQVELLKDNKANLSFKITGKLTFPCSRCLDPVTIEAEDFDFSEEIDLEDKNQLDLRPYINDCLFINEPYHILCNEDCKGLCPTCGVNLNKETCNCDIQEDIDPRLEKLKQLL